MDQDHALSEEVVEVLRLIGRKWSLMILHELTHDPMSFGESSNSIFFQSIEGLQQLPLKARDPDP